MNTYQYVATNALTGKLLAPNVPLVVQSASRTIGGVGQLSGYLELDGVNQSATRGFLNALIPGQTMLWMLQNGFPIWCGILLDSNHQSILSHEYPIIAYTPEQIFTQRLIRQALVYTNMDVFDIARALVAYGTTNIGYALNAQIAGLSLGTAESGIFDSLTLGISNSLAAGLNVYAGTFVDNQPIHDALVNLASADNFEFTFTPKRNGNNTLVIEFDLGAPALGQYNTPVLTLVHPGPVIDYARPIMRSQAANFITGTAAANGTGQTYTSTQPHGVDQNDLAQGNILQETAVTWPGVGVTNQAQINSFVDLQMSRYTAGTMVPQIVLGGGTIPSLGQIGLGDAINFAATSDLDPADDDGEPGLQVTARVTGWVIQPPADQQEEKLTLHLGALVGSTGIGGVGIA